MSKPIPKRIFTVLFFYVDVNQNNPMLKQINLSTPSGNAFAFPQEDRHSTFVETLIIWRKQEEKAFNEIKHTHKLYIYKKSSLIQAVQMCQSNHPPDELDLLLPSLSGSSICVGNRFKKLPWCVVFPSDDSSSSVHVFFSHQRENQYYHLF